jgi:hypothetical protein
MAVITTYLSTLTLNVYWLNYPINVLSRLAHWIKKEDQQSVVYKKPKLLTETNNIIGWKGGRRFTKLMIPENKQ